MVLIALNYHRNDYDLLFLCLFCFTSDQDLETVEMSHFITPENIERLKQAQEANRVQVVFLYKLLSWSVQTSNCLFILRFSKI